MVSCRHLFNVLRSQRKCINKVYFKNYHLLSYTDCIIMLIKKCFILFSRRFHKARFSIQGHPDLSEGFSFNGDQRTSFECRLIAQSTGNLILNTVFFSFLLYLFSFLNHFLLKLLPSHQSCTNLRADLKF